MRPDAEAKSRSTPVLSMVEGREQVLDIDCLLDSFIKLDREGLVITWNIQAEQTFGWSQAEALGRSVSELIIPLRNPNLFERMRRQLLLADENSAQRLRAQVTALHREGTEFEIELVLFPMQSEQDRYTGIFARQVSQRPISENEIRERYRAHMDQLAECYSEMNLRGKMVFVNKAYCETFGVARE